MCEVTWNTWGICERSWCQCMSLHPLKILRFRSLSFLLSVSVVAFFVRCTHTGSSLSLRSLHRHLHVSCARWALSLISSTSPFTSSPSSSSLLSSCRSCCLTSSTSLMSWINSPRISADELGTLAEKNSCTGYEPNDHFITEAYVEYTQESLSEQWFPEDFDYDDVTIGQTSRSLWRRLVVLSVVVVNQSW